MRMARGIAPLWLARLGIGLVACLLAVSMEWLRPGFVESLDEALRDTVLQLQAKPLSAPIESFPPVPSQHFPGAKADVLMVGC